MRFCHFLLLALLLCNAVGFTAIAQPKFEWAKQMGGTSSSSAPSDVGKSIALDKSGNVYVTGNFWGNADFLSGAGTFYLNSAGASDVFICKLRNNGDSVWAKQFSGANYNNGNHIAVDGKGNIYIAGSFQAVTDFDPGSSVHALTPKGYQDAFVCKLDSNGNFIWAKQFGGEVQAVDQCEALGVAVDSIGNVLTTGCIYYGKADFDPGPDNFTLTTAGDIDIFISKLDSSGNFVWAKRIGGTKREMPGKIACEQNGNIYLTGYFIGNVDFDPGPGTSMLSASPSSKDIFICKLNSDGTLSWANRFGVTNGEDIGRDISVDHRGNVYATGTFYYGGTDFDPGPGTYILNSQTGSDVFICKYDSSGNFIWAKSIGGTGLQTIAYSIAVTGGTVSITGSFGGKSGKAVDFDPGPGVLNLFCNLGSSSNSINIFVDQLDTAGNFIGAGQMGGPTGITTNTGFGIASDASGNMYTTGQFVSTADFNPDSLSSYYLSTTNALDDEDIFVSKLSCKKKVEQTPPVAKFESGDTIICSNGCIHFTNQSTDADSIEWRFEGASPSVSNEKNPQTICYSNPGEYSVTLITANTSGKDTLIKTGYIKVVNQPESGIINSSADTICAGSAIQLGVTGSSGTVQWQRSLAQTGFSDISGATDSVYSSIPTETTYYRVTVNNGYCIDSSSIKKITVLQSPVALFTNTNTDWEVAFNSTGSSADVTSWHWDFGDDTFSPLPHPVHTYSYSAVFNVCLTVSNGSNCSFTFCKDITVEISTGYSSEGKDLQKNIFFNPANRSIIISPASTNQNGELKIYNLTGQIVYSTKITSAQTVTVGDLPSGVYFLSWRQKDKTEVKKIIVVR